jgi:hypothetical protein
LRCNYHKRLITHYFIVLQKFNHHLRRLHHQQSRKRMQKKFCLERRTTGTSGASAAAVTASTSGPTLPLLSFQTDPTDGSVSSWMENSQRCIRAAVPKTEVTAQVSAKKFVRANDISSIHLTTVHCLLPQRQNTTIGYSFK